MSNLCWKLLELRKKDKMRTFKYWILPSCKLPRRFQRMGGYPSWHVHRQSRQELNHAEEFQQQQPWREHALSTTANMHDSRCHQALTHPPLTAHTGLSAREGDRAFRCFRLVWRWNRSYKVTEVGKEMVSPFWASAAVASGVATMLQGP